jgi:hypothetical protein
MNFNKKIIIKENQVTIFEGIAKDMNELEKHFKTLRRKFQ